MEEHLSWILSVIIVIAIGGGVSYYAIKKKNKRLIAYLPNFWTGLGVLGTFTTLFCYLGLGNTPIDLANIQSLIKNLSLAFSTSITGILGSIFITFYIKKIQKEEAYEHPYLAKNPKELLYNLHESMLTLEEKVRLLTTSYQQETTKVTNKISALTNETTAFKSKNELLLDKVFRQNAITSESTEESRIANEKLLKMLIAQNIKTTQETKDAGVTNTNELKSIQKQLDGIQKIYTDELAKSLKRVESELIGAFEKLGKDAFNNSQVEVQKANQAFIKKSSELIGQLESGFISWTKTIAQTNEDIKLELQKTDEKTAKQLQQNALRIDKQINATSTKVSEDLGVFSEQVKDIGIDINSSLAKLLAEKTNAIEQTFANLHKWQLENKSQMDSTLTSFNNSVKEYQKTQDWNEKTLKKVENQYEATEKINERYGELIDLLGDYDEKIEALADSVKSIASMTEELNNLKKVLAHERNGIPINS